MTGRVFDIGRVCTKIAGRDAGKKCVVINVIDDNMVTVDGTTRRRKCNTKHLEPSRQMLDIKKDVSTDALINAMLKEKIIDEMDIPKKGTKAKKKAAERPKKTKLVKKHPASETKKKPAKK